MSRGATPAHPDAPRQARIVPLRGITQDRGSLLAGEFPLQIPFVPVRFFVVTGVPADEVRGQHAHRTCHQFLVALAGSLTACVWDSLGARRYAMQPGAEGLYMPPMTYGSQLNYTEDAVLLVLASHPYDVHDYLDSFEDFCALTGIQYDESPGGVSGH